MKENEMVFGIRAVIEAIQADKEIDKILVKRELQGDLSRELFEVLKGRDIPVQRVPAERLDRLTRKNHQGVIAFIPAITYERLENIIPFVYEQGKNPFIVLLDGVTDVRNFGAIARTCECAGVDAIVIPSRGSVTVNADAIKTSAGALHVLSVCKEKSITEAIRFLQASGVKVYAASEKAYENYTAIKYDGPVAIVMGAEDTSERLNYKIAEYALAVVMGKPHFHISFIMNVSPECDCWNHNDAAIVPDLGILASADPVALDKACADMVIQAPILHGNNCLATAHEHDDLCGCDKFHLMHPDTDWLAGLRHAEKIGLGTMEYELVKI